MFKLTIHNLDNTFVIPVDTTVWDLTGLVEDIRREYMECVRKRVWHAISEMLLQTVQASIYAKCLSVPVERVSAPLQCIAGEMQRMPIVHYKKVPYTCKEYPWRPEITEEYAVKVLDDTAKITAAKNALANAMHFKRDIMDLQQYCTRILLLADESTGTVKLFTDGKVFVPWLERWLVDKGGPKRHSDGEPFYISQFLWKAGLPEESLKGQQKYETMFEILGKMTDGIDLVDKGTMINICSENDIGYMIVGKNEKQIPFMKETFRTHQLTFASGFAQEYVKQKLYHEKTAEELDLIGLERTVLWDTRGKHPIDIKRDARFQASFRTQLSKKNSEVRKLVKETYEKLLAVTLDDDSKDVETMLFDENAAGNSNPLPLSMFLSSTEDELKSINNMHGIFLTKEKQKEMLAEFDRITM